MLRKLVLVRGLHSWCWTKGVRPLWTRMGTRLIMIDKKKLNCRAGQSQWVILLVFCFRRFFLGGPLSVRGFNTKGIGPRSESKCRVRLHLTDLRWRQLNKKLTGRLKRNLQDIIEFPSGEHESSLILFFGGEPCLYEVFNYSRTSTISHLYPAAPVFGPGGQFMHSLLF